MSLVIDRRKRMFIVEAILSIQKTQDETLLDTNKINEENRNQLRKSFHCIYY